MAQRVLVLALTLAVAVSMPAVPPFVSSAAYAKASKAKSKPAKTQHSERSKRVQVSAASALLAAPVELTRAPTPPKFVWPLQVTLSTDRATYKAGDLMTIAAVADAACDLTVVSIDSDGFAIVLFPNEYEPNNLMNAGMPITIPKFDAAYQLRASRAGTETLLGICSPPGTRPLGIAADYERYRFTLLGNWSEFTMSLPQRELDIVKTDAAERRKRSRRAPVLAPLSPTSEVAGQGRSVLLISVGESP